MDRFECFNKEYGVSRETFSRLVIYVEVLEKWSSAINLVSADSMEDIWKRHVQDSLQLLKYINGEGKLLGDMGSGAGFPGVVLAIAGKFKNVVLIERDSRKAVFLKEVIRNCKLENVCVLNDDIEKIKETKFDILTARALASLSQLLDWSYQLLNKDGKIWALKGGSVDQEIEDARGRFDFKLDKYKSDTDKKGWIISVSDVSLL